jgi:hypothetical protein
MRCAVSDPAGIAAATVRAHMLLAEGHQPLVMTPGDLRTLLARYQRRLQELADAVEPVTPVRGPDSDRAAGVLFSLRAQMQRRLRDLPHGHPSSPYDEDGSPKPPVLRLQDLDLPEPGEDGSSAGTWP